MDTDTKNKVANALETGVKHAGEAAKAANGWQKVCYIALAVLAWLGTLYLTSCTASQAAQAATWAEIVHDAYHQLHPERSCILFTPTNK